MKKIKLVCNVFSRNENINSMDVATLEEPLTRVLIGLQKDAINDIVDVF